MKAFLLSGIILVCSISAAFTDSETNADKSELLKEKRNNKIEIPDIKLSIEDQSKAQLTNRNDLESSNTMSDFEKIDIAELTRTKQSDKIKTVMTEERKKEDFSLSSFKFYYGLYENFLAEINAGKKTGNLNYLFTYLRNKRASNGYNNTNYFNTELEIDDLDADLIYTLSGNLELNSSIGYYVRNIGLYTNIESLSENKLVLPAKLGIVYNFDVNTTIKAEAGYNYMELNHKIPDGYNPKILWDAYADSAYEANWSRDNFLKISGKYSYSIYSNDIIQYGNLKVLDRFPLGSSFSLQGGLDIDVYNYKSFFWYPTLIGFYKFSDKFNAKLGITGEQKNISPELLRDENQIDYISIEGHPPFPEEKWSGISGLNYMPSGSLSLHANIDYDYYNSYINYSFNNVNGLYNLSNSTNTGIFLAELSAIWMPVENISINASYIYRIPSTEDLIFFSRQSAGLKFDYKYPQWNFEASSRLTYYDKTLYSRNLYTDPVWIWDISLSRSMAKNIFAEIKFNNILNQNYFERPDIPDGGFTFTAGIRITL